MPFIKKGAKVSIVQGFIEDGLSTKIYKKTLLLLLPMSASHLANILIVINSMF